MQSAQTEMRFCRADRSAGSINFVLAFRPLPDLLDGQNRYIMCSFKEPLKSQGCCLRAFAFTLASAHLSFSDLCVQLVLKVLQIRQFKLSLSNQFATLRNFLTHMITFRIQFCSSHPRTPLVRRQQFAWCTRHISSTRDEQHI